MTTADVRQLTRTALVFQRSAADAAQQMARVVTRGALNVKNGWRENAIVTSGRHARLYPYTVNYDVHPIPGGAHAEIGPDRSKDHLQASYGAILEFGSVHNPPHNDGGRALAEEDPRFVAAVAAVTLRMPWR
ncbi:hypothetical protein ACGFWI_01295 [Streptomyces sp. NPDC048434]|uniref:hypothetical protein n=1 Tax=Streptomyces sp. NPDC048434 TaxID=3365549 RepID=UPI0037114872